MDVLAPITTTLDVPSKDYVDKRIEIYIGPTQPTDPLIVFWLKP